MTTQELLTKVTKASSLANQVDNDENWNGYCATGTEGQTWYDTADIARLMQKLHPLVKQINATRKFPKLTVEDATRFGNTDKSLNEDNYGLTKQLKHIRIQLINQVYQNYSVKDVINKLIQDLKNTQKICNYELKQPQHYDKTFGVKKKKLNKLQQQASQIFLLKPYNDYLYLVQHRQSILPNRLPDLSYDFSHVNDGYYLVSRDLLIKIINSIHDNLVTP